MYDPRFDPSGDFPELDDPTFWAAIASQVDTTSLLYPDTQGEATRSPSNPYRPYPHPSTDRLWLPAPSTAAITPSRSTEEIERIVPRDINEQTTRGKKQSSMLLPVCLIILAFVLIFAVTAHTSQKSTGVVSVGPVHGRIDYRALARADAQAAGISPDLFVRQINQESGFDPKAASPAGAIGIAQFLPSTAAGLGIDPWNPEQALQAAARMMASYYTEYGHSYEKALAAYNCGRGCLARAMRLGGSAWSCSLPSETRRYILAIMDVVVCQ